MLYKNYLNMGESFFKLKSKLEELGYNHTLPVEAVPLVECMLADLLQTTRSLQHYMDLSKEALKQRDSLMMEAEPYKRDNAQLIQENNQLHRDVIKLTEEIACLSKESKRKIKSLSEELVRKDLNISKLQHEVRDLSLRGLCAETLSSRRKSKKKDEEDNINNRLYFDDTKNFDDAKITELSNTIKLLQEKNEACNDEILLLKNQVEHRDSEITRLNMVLEGGRPLKYFGKQLSSLNTESKIKKLMAKLHDIEMENECLKKEIEQSLEKQHEAMLKAVTLADKNKVLEEEMKKVDSLALGVEEDCNKKLADMMNELNITKSKAETLTTKNMFLEKEISQQSTSKILQLKELLDTALKDKEQLSKEIKNLLEFNKNIQDKILSISGQTSIRRCEHYDGEKSCNLKSDLEMIFEQERKKYEKHITEIQSKLTETINMFSKHLKKCKDSEVNSLQSSSQTSLIKELQCQVCEREQKILMLKKEIDDLKNNLYSQETGSSHNYRDVIRQLNIENAELSKENIELSQEVAKYKNLHLAEVKNDESRYSKEIQRYKTEIEKLNREIQLLKKDKQEYNIRCKEALEGQDKLRRELSEKLREIEQLDNENSSYKMTNRTDRASTEHLKEECHFLREQIKRMQSEYVKEKTLVNQIKNMQFEMERSNNEIQNELLTTQRKMNMSKDTIASLDKKCKDLESEIMSMKIDKSNLIENIKKVDEERDKLVLELDNKAETINTLEQKIKSQIHEINKLENELSEQKRKLNVNKVSEHKISEYEAQVAFLNGEVSRLTHQFDAARMENKQLQSSLTDANGMIKLNRLELEKSRKEVNGLKQQLQHYVTEIRRIEELLSQKEAERSDMLEHFASLSIEANILENTNHSLESESASKSMQLQNYTAKIQQLEACLNEKEDIIESQSARIAAMTLKIKSLEHEVKLMSEEKNILEQNNVYLKKMCNNLHADQSHTMSLVGNTDSELKLYENRIKSLCTAKAKLDEEKENLKEQLRMSERLLSNARNEIVELKLTLQDATSETKSLQSRLNNSSRKEFEVQEKTLTTEELQLPLMLEETIHEVSHEDEDSSRYHDLHKRYSKYQHGSTL